MSSTCSSPHGGQVSRTSQAVSSDNRGQATEPAEKKKDMTLTATEDLPTKRCASGPGPIFKKATMQRFYYTQIPQ